MASPYETSAGIVQFGGLMQDGDGRNLDMRYAVDAINCDTTGGSLAPMKKGVQLAGDLPAPIGTLAVLYRRFHSVEAEKQVLIAAAGSSLYYRLMTDETWTEIYDQLTNDNLDYVAYEVNEESATIDVLLMTNADDGMICVYGDDLTVTAVTTPYKFGILTRHAERIWGSGIEDYPDKLVYSGAYDPFNWTVDTQEELDVPEDAPGEILQPSWDGDSFVALRTFGDQLLAFKKTRVWRILGTDPGTYIMKEQYGGGTIEENSVVVFGSYAYMLSYNGLMRYDGADVIPFRQQAIKDVVGRINAPYINKAYAAMWGVKYCVAVPVDESTINNAIIVYDTVEHTFNVIEDVNVKAFLAADGVLYYTTDDTPGTVWQMGEGDSLPVTWISGYQDTGRKNAVKSAFIVYLTVHVDTIPDVTPEGGGDPIPQEQGFDMDVTIRTEKKEKKKTFTVLPGDKMKRLNISNSGRWFQIELNTETTLDWRLLGGVQIDMELDHD